MSFLKPRGKIRKSVTRVHLLRCTCAHTHTHTHKHTYTHTHSNTHSHTHTHTLTQISALEVFHSYSTIMGQSKLSQLHIYTLNGPWLLYCIGSVSCLFVCVCVCVCVCLSERKFVRGCVIWQFSSFVK